MNPHTDLPKLPCFPCPHASSCCAYGVTLSDEEAATIEANHGSGMVYQTRWGEWRTRVKKGRCVFYVNGGCSLHDKPYYPTLCDSFPWTDAETGEPYQYDVTICGEFVEGSALLQLQRARLNPQPAR
jgi:hypothetical protein